MMLLRALRVGCFALLAFLSACGDAEQQAVKPAPEELTREAIGYYCNMIVADHQGPKAQIFIKGEAVPVWFSSVRDALAFTILPDEPKTISAIYVNDMTGADWAAPGSGTWIAAEGAHYVIESDRRGGMGALEAVPFAERADAEGFVTAHGGQIVAFSAVPKDYILSSEPEMMHRGAPESAEAEGHVQDHVQGPFRAMVTDPGNGP